MGVKNNYAYKVLFGLGTFYLFIYLFMCLLKYAWGLKYRLKAQVVYILYNQAIK